MLKRADFLTGQGEPLRVVFHTGQHSVGNTKIVSTLYIPNTIGQSGSSTYIIILIPSLVRRWKQTGSNSLLQDFCASTEIKKTAVFRSQPWPPRTVHSSALLPFIHKNRCKFDNSKQLSCAFVFSGDVYVTIQITSLTCKYPTFRFALYVCPNFLWPTYITYNRVNWMYRWNFSLGSFQIWNKVFCIIFFSHLPLSHGMISHVVSRVIKKTSPQDISKHSGFCDWQCDLYVTRV